MPASIRRDGHIAGAHRLPCAIVTKFSLAGKNMKPFCFSMMLMISDTRSDINARVRKGAPLFVQFASSGY